MLVGHIPAGYLWTRFLVNQRSRSKGITERLRHNYLFWGIVASVLPDIDMVYFYLVDKRQHLHHGYWTHIPLFWLSIFIFPLAVGWLLKKSEFLFINIIVLSNVLLHLVLDTIAGKIRWLYPFSRQDFVFVVVPAKYHWAYWNFILHWTFLLELGVIVWAAMIFFASKQHATIETGHTDI